MTMSGDLPKVPLGTYHIDAHEGCDCTWCDAARQAGIQAHHDRECSKRSLPLKTVGGRVVEPNGSVSGCKCTYCTSCRETGKGRGCGLTDK